MDKFGNTVASRLERIPRDLTQCMIASMNVRIGLRVEFGHRFDHLPRSLGRGGIIQKHEWTFSMNGPRKDRKILTCF